MQGGVEPPDFVDQVNLSRIDIVALGPLMELNARDGQNTFTTERAQQSLDYFRSTADQIVSDPEAVNSPEVLKSYSHDAAAAAHLLAAHDFTA